MNTILTPLSLPANTTKMSSTNSSDRDTVSFNSTLHTQIKALNQSQQSNNTPKAIKSKDLLGTIDAMQGNPNSDKQSMSVTSKGSILSATTSKISSDPIINDSLPTTPSQDLLAMIWAMQGNAISPQPVPIPTASDIASNIAAAIGNETNTLAINSADITTDNISVVAISDIANETSALATKSADITTDNISVVAISDIANETSALAINSADITTDNTSVVAISDIANETNTLAINSADITTDNTSVVANSDIAQATAINNNTNPNLTSSSTPSAISTPSMPATIPTYPIAPSVGQSGWNEAINQRIVWMASQNIQTATLNINPEHLGPLQIQIQMDNNQQANVQFFSAQPEVRLALQNSIPMLSQMLEQTGIQLGQSDVSSKNFGSNQQQQKSNSNPLLNESIKLDSTRTVIANTPLNSTGNSLLNIYA